MFLLDLVKLMTDDILTSLSSAFDELALPAHAKLYLACSGGRDSLALAYACFLLYRQGKIIRLPTILHVHHGWQAANDAWMQLVHRWAIEHGFDCQILRITLAKIVRRMPVMHAIKPLAWS